MTAKEKDSILKKAEDHGGRNINVGEYPPIVNHDPWANDSLAKVIKTKEQADFLMMQLEWQRNKANNR